MPGAPVEPNPANGMAAGPVQGGRRRAAGSWMAHVKATMRAYPKISLREALKKAKKTYKKQSKRGGGVITPAPATGGRRRTRRGGNMKLY